MKTDNLTAHGLHQSLVIRLSLSSSELLAQSNWFFGNDTNWCVYLENNFFGIMWFRSWEINLSCSSIINKISYHWITGRLSSKLITKVHSWPGLPCSTPMYAKGLDVRFEKVSRNTCIGHSTNRWPIIYEVHILYIVYVLSLSGVSQCQEWCMSPPLLCSASLWPFTLTFIIF